MKKIWFFGLFFSLILAYSPSAFSTEQNPTEVPTEVATDSYKSLSKGRYIGGGIASIFGFGLGHVIQGRYKRAWIFTAGDFVTFSILSGCALYTLVPKGFGFTSKTDNDRFENTLNVVCGSASLVFVGFRGWEVGDAWNLPSNYKLVKKTSLSLKPLISLAEDRSLNLGLSLNYKF